LWFRPERAGNRLLGLRDAVESFDGAVDQAFDSIRGRQAADRLFYVATAVGDHSVIWLAIAGIRAAFSPRYRRAAARLGLALGFESALVNGAIKTVFRRGRPDGPGLRPHYMRQPRTSSFPSGHASSATCALVLMAENDPAWPLYAMLAAVVAASRLHVRIHHGSDVVGGVVIGGLLGLAIRRLFPLEVS
jgi:undecaprenyl-diphosphatase